MSFYDVQPGGSLAHPGMISSLFVIVFAQGISDIGAVVPAEVQGFYSALGFEKDRWVGFHSQKL